MIRTTGNSDPRVIDGIKTACDLNSKGLPESAAHQLSALIEDFPATASLHGYKAVFLYRAGRLDEAIQHGQQATQLSPKSEKASLVFFAVLWAAGQHLEALDEMKRFLALSPSEEYAKIIVKWNLE